MCSVHMYTYAEARGHLGVPRELKIIYFELGFLTGSGNHQGGQADWPTSPKHLPISTSPVLGSQVCTRAPGIFKTWLLGISSQVFMLAQRVLY